MLADDPEAPDDDQEALRLRPLTGGQVRGSVTIDPGSIQATRPAPARGCGGQRVRQGRRGPRERGRRAESAKQASNFQVINPSRSATGNSLA